MPIEEYTRYRVKGIKYPDHKDKSYIHMRFITKLQADSLKTLRDTYTKENRNMAINEVTGELVSLELNLTKPEAATLFACYYQMQVIAPDIKG
jgi:hypothetical protein